MSRIVFAGPSVAGMDVTGYGLDIRPPARQGDIWRAVQEKPQAVGIIDGYFEGVPAVWHKEILWALHQGIAVLGASSMGALRAAEMDAFGMEGVGQIYEWYRDSIIEDDDEVALVHGPAEIGSPALSLPMVNVRATVAAANAAGLDTGNVVAQAKAQFYKVRTWESVLAAADVAPEVADWIGGRAIDLKRADAEALLDQMTSGDFQTPAIQEPFELTSQWVRATADWARSVNGPILTASERLLG